MVRGTEPRGSDEYGGGPRRDDTEQGRFRDDGVIAVMGAVAGTMPDRIADAITENPDGTYAVRLYRATSAYAGGRSSPGRPLTYTVTPDLPVGTNDGRLTGAAADRVAWPAIMEKTIAGSDQTWTPEQKQAYAARWEFQKEVRNRERAKAGKPPLPDGPVPSGYVRLNQGSTAWDRAEILTALTGHTAEVRAIPDDDEKLVSSIFVKKLSRGKPVLVASRPRDRARNERRFPRALVDSHVYEVVGRTDDGRIELRNPWNRDHPDPLTLDEFREYFQRPNPDGSREGHFTTLT